MFVQILVVNIMFAHLLLDFKKKLRKASLDTQIPTYAQDLLIVIH